MKLGVVGLPNVGKSTLFNAITHAGAEAATYPFCTIEPCRTSGWISSPPCTTAKRSPPPSSNLSTSRDW